MTGPAPAMPGFGGQAPPGAVREPANLAPDGDSQAPVSARRGRKKIWVWVAFLAFSPICLGVTVWAALSWNGSYPTVKPPVPRGWQAIPGVYASFSVPKGWSLQQGLSDSEGDVYYAGRGGAAAESVTQATRAPSPSRRVPAQISNYLGGRYEVTSITAEKLRNARAAWGYRFMLPGHQQAMGTLAWAKGTQSEVWLVTLQASPTAKKILATLTLAP